MLRKFELGELDLSDVHIFGAMKWLIFCFMYYQSVYISLAHRLCADFQYFSASGNHWHQWLFNGFAYVEPSPLNVFDRLTIDLNGFLMVVEF